MKMSIWSTNTVYEHVEQRFENSISPTESYLLLTRDYLSSLSSVSLRNVVKSSLILRLNRSIKRELGKLEYV